MWTPGLVSLLAMNVLVTVGAQALLREGMRRVTEAGPAPVSSLLWRVASSGFVLGGVATFGVSLALWLSLLARLRISTLYPIQQSLIFILLQVVAWKWLGEGIPPVRLLGVAVILAGVYLVARAG
jgi:drug/metabolite transporter (DMT)-like permease